MSSKLLFFVVLSLFNAVPFFGAAQAPAAELEPVYDTTGQSVTFGRDYYIVPAGTQGDGAVGLTNAHNDTCPSFVAHSPNGLPVQFLTPDPQIQNGGIVPVSTDLNVQVSAVTVCVQSTVWKISFFDGPTEDIVVTIGGTRAEQNCFTVINLFKIVKHENDSYKLSFCPDVCSYSNVLCKDVGIIMKEGKRFMGLTDTPFPVRFQKA